MYYAIQGCIRREGVWAGVRQTTQLFEVSRCLLTAPLAVRVRVSAVIGGVRPPPGRPPPPCRPGPYSV